MYVRLLRVAMVFGVLAGAAGCQKKPAAEAQQQPAAAAGKDASNPGGYPAPRWPSYFKTPNSIEDLMPAARSLVRNTSGFQGKGMGILKEGEAVLIVPTPSTDPMVLEAIKRALAERKITVHVKFTNEFMGRTQEQTKATQNSERQG